MAAEPSFTEMCRRYLNERWKAIVTQSAAGELADFLSSEHQEIKSLIQDCLTSGIKSYHYVLPTQVLCKIINPSLNAHSLQTAWHVSGAFDARTIAHAVIVPFDQENSRVLGGSPEPYVNNPLRFPAVTAEYREQQKQRADWDKLIRVLDAVEDSKDPDFVRALFDQILIEIYRLLSGVAVSYPVPNRISLKRTQHLLEEFLSAKSGGDRVEAVCTALFRIIGQTFGIFDKVLREKVNAADMSSGRLADIECWGEGRIVLLVEIKDRSLTLTQLDAKLDVARSRRISEILFVAERGQEASDAQKIDERIDSEFASGQNVYVVRFSDFSLGILIVLEEKGRADFLAEVGRELDQPNSAIAHRKAWAELLKQA